MVVPNAFGQPQNVPIPEFGDMKEMMEVVERVRPSKKARTGPKNQNRPKKQTGKQRATKAKGRKDKSNTKIKNQQKSKRKKSQGPSLKKRIKRLEKKTREKPDSIFTFKQDIAGQTKFGPGLVGYKFIAFWEPAAIETAIDAVPYVPIGAPNTSNTVNTTIVSQNQKVPMELFGKVFFKNNHNMPINMSAYVIEFKSTWTSADANPPTVYGELASDLQKGGLANAALGDAVNNNPAIYPSDSNRWKRGIKVIESYKVRLEAGDEYEVQSSASIKYNQEELDVEGATNKQLRKLTRGVFIRLSGVPAHEDGEPPVSDTVGWSDGGVDYILRRVYKVKGIKDGLNTEHFEVINTNILNVPIIAGMDTKLLKEEQ